MAKFSKNPHKYLVDLPSSKIRLYDNNNGKGVKYVNYLVGSVYCPKKKRSNPKYVCIGKLDVESGKLVPNDKYFELFPSSMVEVMDTNKLGFVIRYGAFLFFRAMAQQIGLEKNLEECFHDDVWRGILDFAQYMIIENTSVMMGCENHFRDSLTYSQRVLYDSDASELFKAINEASIIDFFRHWKKIIQLPADDLLAIDVTSVSSYSQQSHRVQYGYNRDDEDLPQVNSLLVYSSKNKLPLYYEEYNGSVNDKTAFPTVLNHLIDLGYDIKSVIFIMDRGFQTSKNLTLLDEHQLKYIVCCDAKQIEIRKAIKTVGNISIDSTAAITHNGKIFYATVVDADKQRKKRYFLFFRSEIRDREVVKFNKQLRALEEKALAGIPLSKKDIRRLEQFYQYEGDPEAGTITSMTKNSEEVNAHAATFGYFVFVTNIADMTVEQCLTRYATRVLIEQEIDEKKNDIDGRRKRTHTEQTDIGKTFVEFIALTMRTHIRNSIEQYRQKYQNTDKSQTREMINMSGITPRNLLQDLSMVKLENVYSGEQKIFRIMSKRIREEFGLAGISEKDIHELAKKEKVTYPY